MPHRQNKPQDPPWQLAEQLSNHQLSQKERYWLLDSGSLTERLTHTCTAPFSVKRLYQDWRPPLPSELKLLRLPARQQALVREVELRCGDIAVVFARSVFPHDTLSGSLGHLRQLHNQSLGSLLFNHPSMRRTPFEVVQIPGDSDYLPDHLHQQQPAWARRSRFTVDDKSLLVSEVFLHTFTPWPDGISHRRTYRGKIVSL